MMLDSTASVTKNQRSVNETNLFFRKSLTAVTNMVSVIKKHSNVSGSNNE